MSATKFALGSLHITRGSLGVSKQFGDDILAYLIRHSTGDRGEVDEDDRREHELSVKEGFRILSVYTLSNGVKIWIITEADRSATTTLLPDEY